MPEVAGWGEGNKPNNGLTRYISGRMCKGDLSVDHSREKKKSNNFPTATSRKKKERWENRRKTA